MRECGVIDKLVDLFYEYFRKEKSIQSVFIKKLFLQIFDTLTRNH